MEIYVSHVRRKQIPSYVFPDGYKRPHPSRLTSQHQAKRISGENGSEKWASPNRRKSLIAGSVSGGLMEAPTVSVFVKTGAFRQNPDGASNSWPDADVNGIARGVSQDKQPVMTVDAEVNSLEGLTVVNRTAEVDDAEIIVHAGNISGDVHSRLSEWRLTGLHQSSAAVQRACLKRWDDSSLRPVMMEMIARNHHREEFPIWRMSALMERQRCKMA